MSPDTPTATITVPPVDHVHVSRYTRGVIGPSLEMLGPVRDGGRISTGTPPGCWGPMITPIFEGGHEVTQPVAIEGAEVGDAVALKILRCDVTSEATSSGVMEFVEGRYLGDPFVAKLCSACGTPSPASHVEGIGDTAIRCNTCGAEVNAFRFSNGYVIVLDRANGVSLTVDRAAAQRIAAMPGAHALLPERSEQHSILSLARADMAGVAAHMQPFLGNIGTLPSTDIPDSHNAGDFGAYRSPRRTAFADSGATRPAQDRWPYGHQLGTRGRDRDLPGQGARRRRLHGRYACPAGQRRNRRACDRRCRRGRAGSRGDQDLALDGPILLQRPDDLPPMARPMSAAQRAHVRALAARYGQGEIECNGPITFIGSGTTLNAATKNGLDRAAKVTACPTTRSSTAPRLPGRSKSAACRASYA